MRITKNELEVLINKEVKKTLNEMSINESETLMTDDEINKFIDDLKRIGKKYFPKSFHDVRIYKGLGKSIAYDFSIEAKQDWENNIFQNSPVGFVKLIYSKKYNDDLTIPLEVEGGNIAMVLKPDNNYMVYSRKKIPFRKASGDTKKILKAFDKLFSKMKQMVKDNYDNFTEKDKAIIKKYI